MPTHETTDASDRQIPFDALRAALDRRFRIDTRSLAAIRIALAGILHAIGGVDGPTAMAVTLLFRLCSFWVPVTVGGVASAYVTATARHVPDAP